jgi:hypothetical protein
MPFTLAHPAAAIPLRRALGRFGVLPALIIGSLAPDFPYFLPVSIPRATTHTFGAVFWFCVPATVLAYVLYDRLLQAPIVFLLPAPIRARLETPSRHALTLEHLLAVCLSAALGALTHVVWDSFTHASGAAVQVLPPLRDLVADLWGYHLWVFKVLQHVSTIGGSILLAYWSWRWFLRTPPTSAPVVCPLPPAMPSAFVLGSVLLSVLAAGVRAAQRSPDVVSVVTLQVFLGYAAVSFMATFVALVIALAIGWHWRTARVFAAGRRDVRSLHSRRADPGRYRRDGSPARPGRFWGRARRLRFLDRPPRAPLHPPD